MAIGDEVYSGAIPVNSTKLNLTTYGQGSSFPSPYPTDRLFWRSDWKRLYYNKGSEGTPSWEGANVLVGDISMYGGAEADLPAGHLLLDGQAVSRTTYAELFDRLGTEFGVGDGSTTFNVPDFQTSNRFPRGIANDAARGETGGLSVVTLTTAQLAVHTHIQNAHNHTITDPGHEHSLTKKGGGSGAVDVNFNVTFTNELTPTSGVVEQATTGITVDNKTPTNQNAGSGSSHENKPPYLGVHFKIAV